MTRIAFIDRDGTIEPESQAHTLTRLFHQNSEDIGPARFVRRLVEEYNLRFVWNSRNPDLAGIFREPGRLRSMNRRRPWENPVSEHLRLLKSCGIEQEWLHPECPQVVHCSGRTKGQAMRSWLRALNIPVENSIAFDDHVSELEGYPLNRVIGVDARIGIGYREYKQARLLLGAAPKV